MDKTLVMILMMLTASLSAHAEVFRFGVPATHGFEYELAVIRLALDNAEGDHRLEVVPLPVVSAQRWRQMVIDGEQGINFMLSGYVPELEGLLEPVTIPLTRGLLGYRLLAVKEDRLNELSHINTLNELRSFRIGSGYRWQENSILRGNGLSLELGHYQNLWDMLSWERFDIFHRGVHEIFDELEARERDQFAILPGVALAFRFDYFFYVPVDRQDLHRILSQGLINAYNNGSFMAFFESHPVIRKTLELADMENREVIRLKTPEDRLILDKIPERYWHGAIMQQ